MSSWSPFPVPSHPLVPFAATAFAALGLALLGPAPRQEAPAPELRGSGRPAAAPRPRAPEASLLLPPVASDPAAEVPVRRSGPSRVAHEPIRTRLRRKPSPSGDRAPRTESGSRGAGASGGTPPSEPEAVLSDGTAAAGRIAVSDEVDAYRLEVLAGRAYRIVVEDGPEPLGGLALALRDQDRREIARDGSFRRTAIEWVATRSTTISVEIGSWPLAAGTIGDYRLTVVEDEVGDVPAEATPLAVDGDLAEGAFEVSADEDWYRLDLIGGTRYRIETVNLSIGADTILRLYDATAQRLFDESDDFLGRQSRIEWTCPATGTWLLRVEPARVHGCRLGRFALRARRLDPER